MEIYISMKLGNHFQYSSFNQRLITPSLTEEGHKLFVINLDKKEVEIQLVGVDDPISDFWLLGEKEDRLVFITNREPGIALVQLDYAQKTFSMIGGLT